MPPLNVRTQYIYCLLAIAVGFVPLVCLRAECCGNEAGPSSPPANANVASVLVSKHNLDFYRASSRAAKSFADHMKSIRDPDSQSEDRVRNYLRAVTRAEAIAFGVQAKELEFSTSPQSVLADKEYIKSAEKLLEDPEESVYFRIVNGIPDSGQFPDCVACGWMVDGFGDWCCTGTLVAPNVVITAGHCFECVNETAGGRVLFGRSIADPNAKIVNVKKAYRHPGYGRDQHNDLTVLILERDVTDVAWRQLAPTDTLLRDEVKYVRAAGFGSTDFEGRFGYGVRRMVSLPIATKCQRQPEDGGFGCDSQLEFVAGLKALNKDTCKGDSGGPVYVKLADDKWYLLGATSRATSDAPRTCGDGGIYVRLDSPTYADWMKSLPGAHWTADLNDREVHAPTSAPAEAGRQTSPTTNAFKSEIEAVGTSENNPLSDIPVGADQFDIQAQIQDRLRGTEAELYFASRALVGPAPKGKVVHGVDDRKDIYVLGESAPSEKMAKTAAASTCLVTSKTRVFKSGTKWGLVLQDYRQFGLPPCSGERFKQQKVGGWCSGFLIGPDLVATAGHCCKNSDADSQQIAFVFGFYATNETTVPAVYNADQVYFGKRVVGHRLTDEGDFAIIQLDRPVTSVGAKPLHVRRSGDPSVDQRIGLIGCPSGLPIKAAFHEETRIFTVGKVWLNTNLDAYGGNSGSAVFGLDGTVEGILVRGTTDFRVYNGSCFYTNRLDAKEATETVTRASVFADLVPTSP